MGKIFTLLILLLFLPLKVFPGVPPVRYWKTPITKSITQTVPKRADPKIITVLYHNIVYGRTGNVYNRDIYNFEQDLQFFKKNFTIITFDDLIKISEGTVKINTDATIITFDDGDLSMYAIVYPLLVEYDIPATFFIVPTFVGQVGYMNWDQIREMEGYRNKDGEKLFSFESHSLTHAALGELSYAQILYELMESKRLIEQETSQPVSVIALPYGSGAQTDKVRKAAQISGYHMIRTSSPLFISPSSIDLYNLSAFNIESYSNDILIENIQQILKRK